MMGRSILNAKENDRKSKVVNCNTNFDKKNNKVKILPHDRIFLIRKLYSNAMQQVWYGSYINIVLLHGTFTCTTRSSLREK